MLKNLQSTIIWRSANNNYTNLHNMLLLHSRAGCSIQQCSNYNKHICSLDINKTISTIISRHTVLHGGLINQYTTHFIVSTGMQIIYIVAGFVYWLCPETDRLWDEINNSYNGFSQKETWAWLVLVLSRGFSTTGNHFFGGTWNPRMCTAETTNFATLTSSSPTALQWLASFLCHIILLS